MDEHLRATGQSITLRRATNRWLEYALVMWIVALAILALGKWQAWDLTSPVMAMVTVGCVFAAVAIMYNLRFIRSVSREHVLARQEVRARAERDGKGHRG